MNMKEELLTPEFALEEDEPETPKDDRLGDEDDEEEEVPEVPGAEDSDAV